MSLPPLDLAKFTILPVKAQAKEFEPTEEGLKAAILAAIEKASATETAGASDPIGANGHPRMLQLSGWIVFADEINKNYRMFTHADLQEAVEKGMFKAPFFGMIDYNHDFNSYGVWYDAKFAFDEVSQKWGIYAEGVMFAWRYTELADKMLAMQARQGHIDLSMACLAEYYESSRSPDGIDYLIARKPVFFTTSLLDVDPAFPNARAVGSESPSSTQEQRAEELRNSDAALAATEVASMKDELKPETASTEEPTVEEVVTETATDLEEVPTEAPKVEEKPEEKPAEEVASEPEAEEPAKIVVEDLATELATLKVAMQAMKKELDTLVAEKAALSEELEVFRSAKAELEAAAAAEAEAKKREARLAEIPEVIQAEMAKDENAALLEEWMGMDEAKWEATKKVFAVASVARKSLVDASEEEGILSGARDGKAGGKYAISKHVPAVRRGKRGK